MTYEEALIKIKPLKNKKGEYEFWITLQDGFSPASGRAKPLSMLYACQLLQSIRAI